MIKAKKSLGQNFLVDRQVSRRIIEAVSPEPSDIIIEIGPGTGALTKLLVGQCGHTVAIEIDPRLVEEIRRSVPEQNLTILRADALTVDWVDLIKSVTHSWRRSSQTGEEHPRVRVVANLPYYISTAIIEKLVGLNGLLFDLTLMLQDEVVDRIISRPGSREYGYLSVLVQYHCVTEKLFEVPPSAFKPAPKVRSAIVRLAMRKSPPIRVEDEEKLFALVGALFQQRRKTILNNLKAAGGKLGAFEPLDRALERAGIDPRRRAETLSLEEFGALYNFLFSG